MRYWKRIVFILLIGVAIFCSSSSIHAQGLAETITVRVGFPVQNGTSYIDERGQYAGYLVDYLNYIKLYTNWNIEYVVVDGDYYTQMSSLMDMLEKGEIDMLGTMRRSNKLEEKFLYPSYNYGTAYGILAVPETATDWISEDFEHWNELRVAVCPEYKRYLKLLEQYAEISGFSCQIINYDSYNDALKAVHQGAADAVLQMDISSEPGMRPIARFAPEPYYFALYKENSSLLQSLNTAIDKVNQSFPYLKSQLYYKYFSYENSFFISDEEREYIESLGTIRVLFYEGNAPFQYVKDGEVTGCAYTYMNEFAEKTGLKFEIVLSDSYEDKMSYIQNGEIDLIAGIPTDSSVAQAEKIQFSLPYLYSYSILVRSKSNENAAAAEQPVFRSNTEKALQYIERHPDAVFRVDAYSLDFYRQKRGVFENLEADWATVKPFGYSVAVADHMPEQILLLLNRFAASYDQLEQQNLIYQYATDHIEYTFAELLYLYRNFIIIGIVVIFLLIKQIILYLKHKESIRKIAEKEAKVEYLSNYDILTDAYNEHQFREFLAEDCKGENVKALTALNIRDFKYINEMFSSETADEFLCQIKQILDTEIDQDRAEYFCRQSADMFYLVLAENEKYQAAERIRHLCGRIQKKSDELLGGYPVSLYCGVVFTDYLPEKCSVSSKMGYMLAALAHAKKRTTEDICFYDENLHQMEQLRHYIESHMHAALESEEFKLYLQPKKNLKTDQYDQAEALVRWKTKEGKIISPDQFIPLFEENGFCVEFDLYMVEQVCKKLQEWEEQGLKSIGISVNQTKLLFTQDGYAQKLCAITKKYSVSPGLITLELLEGLELNDISRLNQSIRNLKRAGFHISLDDFGSGYSSLNILSDLDIDELKVDRAFLMREGEKENYPRRCAIVEQIIQLAKKIQVQTVAEGVETMEDEQLIKQLKYDYGQGFYYSKPVPADEFYVKFLKNCNKTQQGKV